MVKNQIKLPNIMLLLLVATSAHQNPPADNPFVVKNQNLYFCGR